MEEKKGKVIGDKLRETIKGKVINKYGEQKKKKNPTKNRLSLLYLL